MAREPARGTAVGGEEPDDLFDYDVDFDDVFRPLSPPKPAKPTAENGALRRAQNGSGLGIDEEVEVTRKARAPRVKLDENRLLSQAGIPTLRKRAKDLKFKGKGHEYSDVARLLSFYQLWLDDLFPKAKFLDALDMVEKLGHKKRIQLMRMDLINEGKPKPVQEDSIFDGLVLPQRESSRRSQAPTRIAPIFETSKKGDERLKTPDVNEEIEEDIYGATPIAPRTQVNSKIAPAVGGSLFGPRKTIAPISDEPEDDLDALLAEQEMESMDPGASSAANNQGQAMEVMEHNFDADLEAMAEMEGLW